MRERPKERPILKLNNQKSPLPDYVSPVRSAAFHTPVMDRCVPLTNQGRDAPDPGAVYNGNGLLL